MCYTVSQAQWPTKESRQMQVLCDVVFLSSVPFSYWDTSEGFTFTQTIKFYHYFNFFLFYLKKRKEEKKRKARTKMFYIMFTYDSMMNKKSQTVKSSC